MTETGLQAVRFYACDDSDRLPVGILWGIREIIMVKIGNK
jgi:hypothetical protein